MVEIVVVAFCLLLNGLLACFEMAFVTATKAQLRQLAKSGVGSAVTILKLRGKPERTLSVIQVGITLVGMISAAVGGAGAEESFAPIFESRLGLSENVAQALAIVMVVVPLTFLSVVLGELVPKTIALRDPSRISVMGAPWIVLADRILTPVVTVLELATKGVLRLLPAKSAVPETEQASIDIEHLSQQTKQYVLNLVGVESKRALDVMVPWEEVISVDGNAAIEDVMATAVSSGHTRLPVTREGQVVGVLHTKEFIALMVSGRSDWQSLIRPALRIRKSEAALIAMRLMQERKSHLCIVENSSLEAVGIATLEDVMEEVIGDVYDEDDDGRVRKLLANTARFRFSTK